MAAKIVRRPYVTEKTFDSIERQNKLVFLVSDDANKNSIKQAIYSLYEVKVISINTANTIQGKKAYVRLDPDYSASDLASKLGVL